MDTEDHDEDAMELVMPFIACASNGGPYEDEAFTAGYQAGRIDTQLAAIAAVEGGSLEATVRSDLLAQLDLIAMRHGFTVESEPTEHWPEWTMWKAVRA